MTSRAKDILIPVVLLTCLLGALVVAKGPSYLVEFARRLRQQRIAEENHTERDTLLGWINLPNASLPNQYGAGMGFHTNGARLRQIGEVGAFPPAGRRRVICSGDSFTMGYGVGDASPWCAQLSVLDSSFESLNMGQGGYGLDQVYLWYLRDGLRLHPSAHVVAVITPDFGRMLNDDANGYPKPRLVLSGDSLRVVGVPVRLPGVGPGMVRLKSLFPVIDRLTARLPGKAPSRSAQSRASRDSATWQLARATLRDLGRRDSSVGATFVVVYLPMHDDYARTTSDSWRQWAHEAAMRHEFEFVDLVAELRRLPPDSLESLFLPEGAVAFRSAGRHYTPRGNAWVARELLRLAPGLRR